MRTVIGLLTSNFTAPDPPRSSAELRQVAPRPQREFTAAPELPALRRQQIRSPATARRRDWSSVSATRAGPS